MKNKCVAFICAVIMLSCTVSVAGIQDSNENDGDVNPNPWENLLTKESENATTTDIATTANIATTADVVTTTEEEAVPETITTSEQITKDNSGPEKYTTVVSTTTNTVDITSASKEQKRIIKRENIVKPKIKSATKKRYSNKVKVKIKKVSGISEYNVQISKNKKFTKIFIDRKIRKASIGIRNKKIRNQKKMYIRVRSVKTVANKTYYSNWSKIKKVRNK